MTEFQTLQHRLTRRYVGTYSHLDEWEDVGAFRILASGSTEEEDDGSYTTTHLVDAEGTNIKEALEDTFTHVGCAHEHDCCGCYSSMATALRLLGNRWEVTIRHWRNI